MQTFSALLLNLDRDAERLAHMQDQLAKAGVAFERQPGVLGDDVPADLRSLFFDAQNVPKTTLKRGEIGCYASHLRAMMRMASGSLGPAVLVMEDDLALVPGFCARVQEIVEKAPRGWDIVRLASPPRRAYLPSARLGEGYRLIRYSRIPMGAGAYLITPEGARKFLQKGFYGQPFDVDLGRPWLHGLRTYGTYPPLAEAGVLKSTIDSVENRALKKRSPAWTRLKNGTHAQALSRVCYNIRFLGLGGWLACSLTHIAEMLGRPVFGRGLIHKTARLWDLCVTKR